MAEPITGDKLLEGAVPALADKLALGWNFIGGGDPMPTRPELEAKAKVLIETGNIEVKDKDGQQKTININELNDENKALLTQQGVDIEGLQAFSDPERREKFASAIDAGVQSQDTFWSNIVNFFSGLMSWLLSGFDGGFAGLWEKVGEAASNNVRQAVDQSVSAAMQNDRSLEPLGAYMGQVNETIHTYAMSKATTGDDPPKRDENAPLPEALAMSTDAVKKRVAGDVQEAVQIALNDKNLNDDLGPLLGGSNMETRRGEFKAQLIEFVEKTAFDTEFKLGDKLSKEMSLGEFKGAVRSKLVEHFDQMQVTGDDGNKASLSAWYKKEWIDGWVGANARRAANTSAYIKGEKLMPADASELSGYLADNMMEKITDAQLQQFKDARGLAENNYQLNILDVLEQSQPGIAKPTAAKPSTTMTDAPATPAADLQAALERGVPSKPATEALVSNEDLGRFSPTNVPATGPKPALGTERNGGASIA